MVSQATFDLYFKGQNVFFFWNLSQCARSIQFDPRNEVKGEGEGL